MLRASTGQELANYGPWTKSGPPLVFVNKVLLEHSHAHCVYVMSLATFLLQEQNYYVVVTETMSSQSLKYLLSGPLQNKFANSWIRQWLYQVKSEYQDLRSPPIILMLLAWGNFTAEAVNLDQWFSSLGRTRPPQWDIQKHVDTTFVIIIMVIPWV